MSRTQIVVGVAFLVVVAVGYFLFFSSSLITNYPPKDGPIVAFGDSLVEGVGASQEGRNFVSLLSQKINEPIVNVGVSGDTTKSGLERIDEVLSYEPRLVLVLLGGNDYLRRTPRDETFSNLSLIIEQLQESGAVVALLGVRGGLLRDNFEASYAALAAEKGAVYVPDVLDGIIGTPGLMFDQIHPNDQGYAKIADKVYEHVAPYLR